MFQVDKAQYYRPEDYRKEAGAITTFLMIALIAIAWVAVAFIILAFRSGAITL